MQQCQEKSLPCFLVISCSKLFYLRKPPSEWLVIKCRIFRFASPKFLRRSDRIWCVPRCAERFPTGRRVIPCSQTIVKKTVFALYFFNHQLRYLFVLPPNDCIAFLYFLVLPVVLDCSICLCWNLPQFFNLVLQLANVHAIKVHAKLNAFCARIIHKITRKYWGNYLGLRWKFCASKNQRQWEAPKFLFC